MGLGWCTWTNGPWNDRFIVRRLDYFGIEEFRRHMSALIFSVIRVRLVILGIAPRET